MAELSDKQLLYKVSSILSTLRALNPTMSMLMAETFVQVALNEGKGITEVSKLLGFKTPTVSRMLLDLGVRNRFREPGLQLIESVTDPMELRRKKLELTPKGRVVIRQITDTMRG